MRIGEERREKILPGDYANANCQYECGCGCGCGFGVRRLV